MPELIVYQDKKIIDRLKTEKDTITIGRDPKCDITLNDDYVSSLHAVITFTEDAAIVADQGSTNGTSVNGKKITKAKIGEDATICIENFQIKIKLKTEKVVDYADPSETIVIPPEKKTPGKKYYL